MVNFNASNQTKTVVNPARQRRSTAKEKNDKRPSITLNGCEESDTPNGRIKRVGLKVFPHFGT